MAQSIEELEFERGIWVVALNGDSKKLKQMLDSGKNPNLKDISGNSPKYQKFDRIFGPALWRTSWKD